MSPLIGQEDDLTRAPLLADSENSRVVEHFVETFKFSEKWETTRANRLDATTKVDAGADKPSPNKRVKVQFRFYGPTMDEDLTRFYDYFAENRPATLEPVEIDWPAVANYCKDSRRSCPTLSDAAFFYGNLTRYYPDSGKVLDPTKVDGARNEVQKADQDHNTSNTPPSDSGHSQVLPPADFTTVAKRLKRLYGRDVLPGIRFDLFEQPLRLRSPSSGEKTLCSAYRIDGKDNCIVHSTPFYTYLLAQGVGATVMLPAKDHERLLSGYKEFVSNSPGFREHRMFFYAEPETGTSLDALESEPVSKKMRVALNSLQEQVQIFVDEGKRMFGLEGEGITDVCPASEKLDMNILRKEMRTYRRYFFDPDAGGLWPAGTGASYPRIHFIDHAPTVEAMGIWQSSHTDWTEQRDDNIYKPCLVTKPKAEGHGIFTSGMLLARVNGFGMVGFTPSLSRQKVTIYSTPIDDANALWKAISRASSDILISNRLGVVSVSAHIKAPDGLKTALRTTVTGGDQMVLYVVSAGQQQPSMKSAAWLPEDCTYYPACLATYRNVIAVGSASLKGIALGQLPTPSKSSNKGAPFVSVLAPGEDILSTDFDIEKDTNGTPVAYHSFSRRSGTSTAVPFVTAIAAEIVRQVVAAQPDARITAAQIKRRILSTADPIQDSTGHLQFFEDFLDESGLPIKNKNEQGSVSPVFAGMINGTAAISHVTRTVVIGRDGSTLIGDISELNFDNRELVSYFDEFRGSEGRKTCPQGNLLRIRSNEDRKTFAIACSNNEGLTFVSRGHIIPGSNENSCISDGNCIVLKNVQINDKPFNDRQKIDLRTVENIYFRIK